MHTRVEDWYHPRLGRFIGVDRDGVLCHAGYNDVDCTQLDDGGRSVPPSPIGQLPEHPGCGAKADESISTDSLVFGDLTEGMLWLNPEEGIDPGQYTNQTSNTVEGLVSPCPLVPYIILNNRYRDWDYAFYENFLDQISDLAGRPFE